MTWVKVVTGFNVVVAALLWLPAWGKMRRRRSSADYSLVTVLSILWLQLSNAAAALYRGHALEFWWFAANGCMVLVTALVILHYRGGKG